MRSTITLLLVLLACRTGQAQYVDRELGHLTTLIDSLVTVTGWAPDSILFRPTPLNGPANSTGFYDPTRRQMRVSPASQNRRRTLLHEFGHLLQHDDQLLLFTWTDQEIGLGRMPSRDALERFADDFRDAFDALSHHTLPRRSGPRMIALVLAQRAPFVGDALARH